MALLDQIKESVGLKREESERFFWVVYLSDIEIAAALAKIQAGELEILQTMVGAVDEKKGLSGLTRALGDFIKGVSFEKKPREVFFGVPDSWLADAELKKPHQEALEKLTQDLNLVFSGFAPSLKAILGFYRRQEGVPANLILLEILPKKIRAVVCQKGKVFKVGEKEREESLSVDLEGILKRDFTGESLPSRIIILGKEDFGKTKEEILTYPFEQTGLFLHLPRIESFSKDDLLKAISFFAKESLDGKPREIKTEKKEEDSRFGFVVGRDVSQKVKELPKEPQKDEVSLAETAPVKKLVIWPPFSPAKIFARLKKISLPPFRLKLPRGGKVFSKPAFLAVGAAALLISAFILIYWYLPKAKITIFVEPKELKETIEIAVVPEGFEASGSAKVLRGRLITMDISGELSAQVTGTKLTGEKAVGKVAVFNKTVSSKNFSQGAEIIGPNDLVFTLDSPVSIDSATISTSSGSETKVYGKAEVSVTAKGIGSEYNLPGGISFSLGNFSDTLYSAQSDEGFAGGSSQEVTVVSAEDQEGLEEDLMGQLKEKAREKFQEDTEENLKFFLDTITLEVKNRSFDSEVGEEAETVNLSLEAEAQTLGFAEDSLNELLAAEISEKIPEEFELIPNQIKSQEKFKEKQEEALIIEVEFQVNLLPDLNLTKVKKKIVGKKPDVARDYLTSLPHVVGAQITLWPSFPSSFWNLPRKVERLSIDIKPE